MKNNYVAKHCKRFNMASVHVNRKRALAAGYCKHKSPDISVCESDLGQSGIDTPDDEESPSEDVTDAHTNGENMNE